MSQNDKEKTKSPLSKAPIDHPMSNKELDDVAAAGLYCGTSGTDFLSGSEGRDYLYGGDGTDVLQGGGGNDHINGDDGSDMLFGGDGNDTLDGGEKDGANDIAEGGAGDDTYWWRVQDEGHDTFHGGEGNDTIKLWDLGRGTLESVWNAGNFNITLTDANGNGITITEDMFDDNGDLILPAGCSGVVTGPEGETMTFDGVEKITKAYT